MLPRAVNVKYHQTRLWFTGSNYPKFPRKKIWFFYDFSLLFCYTEPFPNLFSDFDISSFILYQRKFYKWLEFRQAKNYHLDLCKKFSLYLKEQGLLTGNWRKLLKTTTEITFSSNKIGSKWAVISVCHRGTAKQITQENGKIY